MDLYSVSSRTRLHYRFAYIGADLCWLALSLLGTSTTLQDHGYGKQAHHAMWLFTLPAFAQAE